MGVILDSCVWVDIERGRLKPVDVAALIHNAPVYLTPTILAELYYGAERAATPEQQHQRLSALARLKRKPCLIHDADTGMLFGRIAASLDAQGRPSKYRLHDLWIAAAAIQHGFALLTLNSADFADIPGLQLITF